MINMTQFYKTKIALAVMLSLNLAGCSLFIPDTGTHYEVEYDKIKVKVDDYTDREGIEFEYTNENGTTVTLKKALVDTSTPADVIMGKSAENQAKALELLDRLVK